MPEHVTSYNLLCGKLAVKERHEAVNCGAVSDRPHELRFSSTIPSVSGNAVGGGNAGRRSDTNTSCSCHPPPPPPLAALWALEATVAALGQQPLASYPRPLKPAICNPETIHTATNTLKRHQLLTSEDPVEERLSGAQPASLSPTTTAKNPNPHTTQTPGKPKTKDRQRARRKSCFQTKSVRRCKIQSSSTYP